MAMGFPRERRVRGTAHWRTDIRKGDEFKGRRRTECMNTDSFKVTLIVRTPLPQESGFAGKD